MSYQLDQFQACLNQCFSLQLGDYSDELELIQVDRLGESDSSFAIVLQSNNPEPIAQQTCRLSNAQLGELDLFIVAIGGDDSGVRYEAVFS